MHYVFANYVYELYTCIYIPTNTCTIWPGLVQAWGYPVTWFDQYKKLGNPQAKAKESDAHAARSGDGKIR